MACGLRVEAFRVARSLLVRHRSLGRATPGGAPAVPQRERGTRQQLGDPGLHARARRRLRLNPLSFNTTCNGGASGFPGSGRSALQAAATSAPSPMRSATTETAWFPRSAARRFRLCVLPSIIQRLDDRRIGQPAAGQRAEPAATRQPIWRPWPSVRTLEPSRRSRSKRQPGPERRQAIFDSGARVPSPTCPAHAGCRGVPEPLQSCSGSAC